MKKFGAVNIRSPFHTYILGAVLGCIFGLLLGLIIFGCRP